MPWDGERRLSSSTLLPIPSLSQPRRNARQSQYSRPHQPSHARQSRGYSRSDDRLGPTSHKRAEIYARSDAPRIAPSATAVRKASEPAGLDPKRIALDHNGAPRRAIEDTVAAPGLHKTRVTDRTETPPAGAAAPLPPLVPLAPAETNLKGGTKQRMPNSKSTVAVSQGGNVKDISRARCEVDMELCEDEMSTAHTQPSKQILTDVADQDHPTKTTPVTGLCETSKSSLKVMASETNPQSLQKNESVRSNQTSPITESVGACKVIQDSKKDASEASAANSCATPVLIRPEQPNTTLMGFEEKAAALKAYEVAATDFIRKAAELDQIAFDVGLKKVKADRDKQLDKNRLQHEAEVEAEIRRHAEVIRAANETHGRNMAMLKKSHEGKNSATQEKFEIASQNIELSESEVEKRRVRQKAVQETQNAVKQCKRIREETEMAVKLLSATKTAGSATSIVTETDVYSSDDKSSQVVLSDQSSMSIDRLSAWMTADHIFNLCCVYADVREIRRFETSSSRCAVVRFWGKESARCCLSALSDGRTPATFLGFRSMSESRADAVKGANPKTWHKNHPLHRHSTQNDSRLVGTPGRTLLCSIHAGANEALLTPTNATKFFHDCGAPLPLSLGSFTRSSVKIEFKTTIDAMSALMRCNNRQISDSGVCHLSFANTRIEAEGRILLGAASEQALKAAKPVATEDTLPPGWERMWDPSKKRHYYVHREKRLSQWRFPMVHENPDGNKLPAPAKDGNQRQSPRPECDRASSVNSAAVCTGSIAGSETPSQPHQSASGVTHDKTSQPTNKDLNSLSFGHPAASTESLINADEVVVPPDPELLKERPHEHFCPITLEVMDCPVMVLSCGCTVEKATAEDWFAKFRKPIKRKKAKGQVKYVGARCPACDQDSDGQYVHNKAVARLIQQWGEEL